MTAEASDQSRDRLFSMPMQRVGDFAFDEQVVRVFPDMIARSVPGYASMLSMIEQLTARFVRPGTNIYDLGCSLGAGTRLIRRQAPQNCVIHAVDMSGAMLERLRSILATDDSAGCPVELHEADLRGLEMHFASFVVLNLTLQFIPPEQRQDVLQNVCRGLIPGGALLLSEKVCFDDSAQQRLLTDLHHDFKRAHGYSDLEIAQKRTAIENCLIPETMETHLRRLRDVGFSVVVPWFQCFSFISILAVKSGSEPSVDSRERAQSPAVSTRPLDPTTGNQAP